MIMLDYVSRLLFEDLSLLLLAEVIGLAVVLAVHRRRMTKQSRRLVWVALVVCVLLIVIQSLTITKRESLQRMVTELGAIVEAGVEQHEQQRIIELFDGEFQLDQGKEAPLRKKEFLGWLMRRLGEWQIAEVSVRDFEIELTKEDEASVSFWARCDVSGASGGHALRNVVSHWKLYCVWREDGWKVFRFEEGRMTIPYEMDLLGVFW